MNHTAAIALNAAGYNVTLDTIPATDNHGDDCIYCQTIGHTNEITLYLHTTDGDDTADCCRHCVVAAAANHDTDRDLHVEVTA